MHRGLLSINKLIEAFTLPMSEMTGVIGAFEKGDLNTFMTLGKEFAIDAQGMHIGRAFRNVTGILPGHPANVAPEEMNRIGELFKEKQA